MNKQFFLLALWLTALPLFAQENKFSKGDFGIKYGMFFGDNYSSELSFSGMVTNSLEVGGGVTVIYDEFKSVYEQDAPYINTLNGLVSGRVQNRYKNAAIGVKINPFVAYHFPIKSNLDVWLGVNVGFGISNLLKDESTTETTATGYTQKNITKRKFPVRYGVNGGLSVGCQYFFYKNIAIGVQAGLGTGYDFSKGKTITETTMTGWGTAHPNPGKSTSTAEHDSGYQSFGLRANGNVGVTLMFYISPKQKTKATQQ